MPLDARKVARAASLRARIRAGRTETVVLVAAADGTTGTQVVAGAVWHDRHDAGPSPVAHALVPGVSGRTTGGGTSWDATVEIPGTVSLPPDLRYVARATSTGAVATSPRYAVVDMIRAGLGAGGDRWQVRLRRLA
jgi:hypothetical protein